MQRSSLLFVATLVAACTSQLAATHPTADGTQTSTNTDGTTTGGGTTTGNPDTGDTEGPLVCSDDAECSESAAFCVQGRCVGCDLISNAATCAERDPSAPVCAGGKCVECTADNDAQCEGKTPVCDAATNTCVACTEHAQCGESACYVLEGSCLGGMVYVVDADDPNAYQTIGGQYGALAALNGAGAGAGGGAEGTIVVHAREGGAYQDHILIPEKATMAIIAADGEMPVLWRIDGPSPAALTVQEGATLYLEGLRVDGDGVGVAVNGGTAHISRSQVVNNIGGGITVDGGQLRLVNSMVGQVGGVAALDVAAGTASILYSTLVGGGLTGQALRCDEAASVSVRNSIVAKRPSASMNEVEAIACGDADISYSLVGTPVEDGEGNVLFDGDPVTLFDMAGQQTNFENGNYSLISTDSPAAGVAQWQVGDPTTDFHGEARPTTPGEMDYAGADVPQ